MNKAFLKFGLLIFLGLVGNTASAHTGSAHVGGFFSGLTHPFLGLDHTLVMLGVGLWASRLPRVHAGLTVAAFLSFMVSGAVCSLLGWAMEGLEPGILGSVLFMGLVLASSHKLSALLIGALLAGFGFLHGFAHGLEMPAAASPVTYAAGFALATVILQAMGYGLGFLLNRHKLGLQIFGFITGGLGLYLFINA